MFLKSESGIAFFAGSWLANGRHRGTVKLVVKEHTAHGGLAEP